MAETFDEWWKKVSTEGPQADTLDNFNLADQAMIVGWAKLAWHARDTEIDDAKRQAAREMRERAAMLVDFRAFKENGGPLTLVKRGEVSEAIRKIPLDAEPPAANPATPQYKKRCPCCGYYECVQGAIPGKRPTLMFGDGDYSCATCGLGMKEPCEHWKQMLAAPSKESEK